MSRSQQAIRTERRYFLRIVSFLAGAGAFLASFAAQANPALVMDVDSGNVLYQEQASDPWYPASLTKLMTMYVALSAVRDHKIALDTPLVVSARAAAQAPSKMGFAPGTQVTLDNALKMLMVKSANDMAVTIAEGVSGSVEAFAEDMNAAAASLGLRQSHFVNPNGLHDPAHVSSARDLAQIARALYLTFPEQAGIYAIGTLQLGDEKIPTHNNLLGRYPGADGMKTGFTCSAGFNLVASAQRNGHHYIAVVLGAPTVAQRLVKAAILLDRAFAGVDHAQAENSISAPAHFSAPDLHEEVCSKRRSAAIARFQSELETLQAPLNHQGSSFVVDNALFPNAANEAQKASQMARKVLSAAPVFEPVSVYVGPAPGYTGLIAQARPPHSPVGTEPPPEAASAYATLKPATLDPGVLPLKPDVNALPLKGHDRRKAAHQRAHGKIVAHAKAEETEQTKPHVKNSAGSHRPEVKNAGHAGVAVTARAQTDVSKETTAKPHAKNASGSHKLDVKKTASKLTASHAKGSGDAAPTVVKSKARKQAHSSQASGTKDK